MSDEIGDRRPSAAKPAFVMARLRRLSFAFLKTATSIGLLWFISTKMNLDATWAAVENVDPVAATVAVLLLVGSMAIGTKRWSIVLQEVGRRLPSRLLFAMLWVGVFFNQALPSSIGGDAVRVWRSHRAGVALRVAITAVLLERLSGFVGLVVLFGAALLLFSGNLESSIRLPLFAIFAASVTCIAGFFVLDWMPLRLRRWAVLEAVTGFAADARRVFLDPGLVTLLLALSVAGHAVAIGAVYVLAAGLGFDIGLPPFLVAIPASLLVALIPFSIAGWGVREGAMVLFLSAYGVSYESAFVLSVLFGLALLAAGLPGGLLWLFNWDLRGGPANSSDWRVSRPPAVSRGGGSRGRSPGC